MRYFIITLLFLSCTKKESGPVDTLNEYIGYRFSKNQSKEKLLERTTGELYRDLNGLSEEALNALVDSERYRRGSLKINLKKCSQTRCHITYTLKILKREAGQRDFEIEVKKIARLDREGEAWKISRISELKSHIGTEKPINVEVPGETRNPFQSK